MNDSSIGGGASIEQLVESALSDTIGAGAALSELALRFYGRVGISDEDAETLSNLLMSNDLVSSARSSKVLGVIEEVWPVLSPEHQRRLVAALETSYPLFRDWMSQFVITEIIGRWDPTHAGLDALDRLRRIVAGQKRALLANGYARVTSLAVDAEVTRRAVSALASLAAEGDEGVASEVRDCIKLLCEGAMTTAGHPLAVYASELRRLLAADEPLGPA